MNFSDSKLILLQCIVETVFTDSTSCMYSLEINEMRKGKNLYVNGMGYLLWKRILTT